MVSHAKYSQSTSSNVVNSQTAAVGTARFPDADCIRSRVARGFPIRFSHLISLSYKTKIVVHCFLSPAVVFFSEQTNFLSPLLCLSTRTHTLTGCEGLTVIASRGGVFCTACSSTGYIQARAHTLSCSPRYRSFMREAFLSFFFLGGGRGPVGLDWRAGSGPRAAN